MLVAATRYPLTDAVLFEGLLARASTDSPRAISDALHAESADVPIYSSINDFSVACPTMPCPSFGAHASRSTAGDLQDDRQ